MNKLFTFTSIIVSAATFNVHAEGLANHDVLDTKSLDALNSQEHYWKKIGNIETAKNQAIQLQIKNNNLSKTVGSSEFKLNSAQLSKQEDIIDFLDDSKIFEKTVALDDSKQQEQILSNKKSPIPSSVRIASIVNPKPKVATVSDDESATDALKVEQKKFFDQMAGFLNTKISAIESRIDSVINKPDDSVPTPIPNIDIPNDANIVDIVQDDISEDVEKVGFGFAKEQISKFHEPVGRIKSVSPKGIEVVLAYEWLDREGVIEYASGMIGTGDTILTMYPQLRDEHKYEILKSSPKHVQLKSPSGYIFDLKR